MYTINDYNQNILTLTNSLTIKLIDVAISINLGLYKKSNITTGSDKTTWKYFLNIAGLPHSTNNDIYLYVIETGTTEKLTKELLETNAYTKKELLKMGTFYTELITKYPDDLQYIRGCMFPVDIQTAIDAPDGTILAYNPIFVEESEYSLISSLEVNIKNFLVRWNVRAYGVVDELFVPALVGVLFSTIPNMIHNIRLNNINTSEVHSFHLEHFFRSHLDLWDDVQVLNKSSLYWLYSNIKYLLKHVGKESTFDMIVDKIFHSNSIGVGELILKTPVPTFYESNDFYTQDYVDNEITGITKPLNDSYILDKNMVINIPTIVELECETVKDLKLNISTEEVSAITREVQKTLSKNTYENLNTKVLDLNITRLFKTNGVDLYLLMIDYWIQTLIRGNFNTTIDYTNPLTNNNTTVNDLIDYVEPNTNQMYTISPRSGMLMLIKLLLVLSGNEDIPLTKLTTSTILENDVDYFDLVRDNIWNDGYVDDILDILREEMPQPETNFTTPEAFGEYLLKVIDYYKLIWTLDSNSENSIVSTNIKQITNRLITNESLDLTIDGESFTVNELLLKDGIVYNVNNSFDLLLSITSLIKTFTNIEVNEYADISTRLSSFTSIMNKLTSYTIQVINNTDDTSPLYIYYNNVGNLRTKNGLIKVMEATLTPLEEEFTHIKAYGNDFRNITTVVPISPNLKATSCIKAVIGLGSIYTEMTDDILVGIEAPRMNVEIYDSWRCDSKDILDRDIFITSITGILTPLEEVDIISSTSAESKLDDLISIIGDITPTAELIDSDIITGIVTADIKQTADIVLTIPEPIINVDITTFETTNENSGIPIDYVNTNPIVVGSVVLDANDVLLLDSNGNYLFYEEPTV